MVIIQQPDSGKPGEHQNRYAGIFHESTRHLDNTVTLAAKSECAPEGGPLGDAFPQRARVLTCPVEGSDRENEAKCSTPKNTPMAVTHCPARRCCGSSRLSQCPG
jgi:hypothetical protein